MRDVREVVIAMLEAEGLPFEPEGDTRLFLRFTGENGRWICSIVADDVARRLLIYSISPIVARPDRLTAAMELVTRASFDLPVGNFELDLERGAIRFKTSLDLEGVELEPERAAATLFLNLAAMDRYLPGLAAVIEDGASPKDVLLAIEG